MPWRSGGTLWNIAMWQGSVTDGITVRAHSVLRPAARKASIGACPPATTHPAASVDTDQHHLLRHHGLLLCHGATGADTGPAGASIDSR